MRWLLTPFLASMVLLYGCVNEARDRNDEQEEMVVSESIEDEFTAVDTVDVEIRALGNNMREMSYDQEQITVPAGSVVRVTMVNEGEDASMVHNVVFVEKGKMEQIAQAGIRAGVEQEYVPDNPVVIAHSGLVQPGETKKFSFTAPAAGTYEFVCTFPGHWQKMNGTFTVTANG